VHDFHERRVEGIIITGSEAVEVYLSAENKFFMPIVLVNSPAYPFSVSVNGLIGAKKVVEHLIALGHRRIAYVIRESRHPDGLKRLDGYRAALSEHNIVLDEALIVAGDGGITGGIKAVPQLLDLCQPPTAIFCFNDMTAIGVINALRQKGYEVPHDFSVAGYDDLEMAPYYHPALTTVRPPTYRIGRSVVDMLLKLIQGGNGVVPEIVEPELVIRGSTAPLAHSLVAHT
jgi:DNA-binding LacI/PurR family transcriptional regulator